MHKSLKPQTQRPLHSTHTHMHSTLCLPWQMCLREGRHICHGKHTHTQPQQHNPPLHTRICTVHSSPQLSTPLPLPSLYSAFLTWVG